MIHVILNSAVASLETMHVEPIFLDIIFIIISLSGIGMSLTLDHNRPDVKRKISIEYVIFSLCASVSFSLLGVAAHIHFEFGKFYFYLLTAVTSSLSPQFARRILPEAPEELKKGAFTLLSAFFSGIARKLDPNKDNNINPTNDEENDSL